MDLKMMSKEDERREAVMYEIKHIKTVLGELDYYVEDDNICAAWFATQTAEREMKTLIKFVEEWIAETQKRN